MVKSRTILLSIGILILMAVTFIFFYPMKQLPSPIYGGDVFYHYGVVKHIFDGDNPLMNSQFEGEWAHYPWFMHTFVAFIAKIDFLGPVKTAILFPVVMTFLAGIISWQLAKRVFNSDESLPLLFVGLFTAGLMVPMLTATSFTILIMFPLFILLAYFSPNKFGWNLLTGLTFGLLGLTHIAGFVGGALFLLLLSMYRRFSKQATTKEELKRLFIVGLIGGLIALLYWGPPILAYHLQTPNRWSSYVAAGESIGVSDIFNKLKNLFFNTSSVASLLLSLTALGGLILSIIRLRTTKLILPLLLFITAFIGFIHPMITLPILHTSIGSYGFDVVFLLAIPLLSMAFFYNLLPKKAETTEGVQKSSAGYFFIALLATLFTGFLIYHTYVTFNQDIWTNAGRSDSSLMRDLYQASDVLDKSPEGVILPLGDESGFAINAVSGKKVVFARRTHTSPFVDANKRYADAAVMLFGNNTEVKKSLFNEYKVTYMYADQYALQQLSACFVNWEAIQGDASLNCLRTSEEYEQYLTDNGITWKTTVARLDPASSVAPTFKVVAIKPNPIELSIKPILTTDNLQVSEVSP